MNIGQDSKLMLTDEEMEELADSKHAIRPTIFLLKARTGRFSTSWNTDETEKWTMLPNQGLGGITFPKSEPDNA